MTYLPVDRPILSAKFQSREPCKHHSVPHLQPRNKWQTFYIERWIADFNINIVNNQQWSNSSAALNKCMRLSFHFGLVNIATTVIVILMGILLEKSVIKQWGLWYS